jgi:hypothetical protein
MRRKTSALAILLAASAIAQENAPSGFLHGTLLVWNGTPRNGEFTFEVPAGGTYVCSFDEKTYIERESRRVNMAGVDKGDRLEVVSDRRQGSTLCYARTVHVLEAPRLSAVAGVRPRPQAIQPALLFERHPNLTFSGAVFRLTPDYLVLRSRSGEHQALRLRPDTRYLNDGQAAAVGSLSVNTVVFVRAARDLYGDLEAYQVIWGDILRPDR